MRGRESERERETGGRCSRFRHLFLQILLRERGNARERSREREREWERVGESERERETERDRERERESILAILPPKRQNCDRLARGEL